VHRVLAVRDGLLLNVDGRPWADNGVPFVGSILPVSKSSQKRPAKQAPPAASGDASPPEPAPVEASDALASDMLPSGTDVAASITAPCPESSGRPELPLLPLPDPELLLEPIAPLLPAPLEPPSELLGV